MINDKLRVCTAPEDKPHRGLMAIHGYRSVFLAGSIEMGTAENWQDVAIASLLKIKNALILNPRRESWDSSWEQRASNSDFSKQVWWELNGLDDCDIILMHFDPNTWSPITLMELGLHAGHRGLVISCPDGFYRKGNVEIVAEKFRIPLYNNLEDAILHVKRYI